jgi:predicted NAD/FAD-binding protein
MKIAVVGAGVSGLTAAFVLARRHEVALFEANHYAGGHANTVQVAGDNGPVPVDTGFIVFNELNYPNLCRLFDLLDVDSERSDMSFSVHCEASGLEYNGTSLNKLFGQRRNLARPAFWRMVADIVKFNRRAVSDLEAGLADDVTVDQYLSRNRYSDTFARHYLMPLGASLWSCDTATFGTFPVRFVIEFLHNHRMLQVEGRPVWRTVSGGSRAYVDKLLAAYRGRVHLGAPVRSIQRTARGVEVGLDRGKRETFDEAVLATHADKSLGMLREPDDRERETLSMFPYRRNRITLHTDTTILPDRRNIWAAWNYRIPAGESRQTSVTYNMNILQNLPGRRTWCVSLNPDAPINEEQVIRRIDYDHPMFIPGRDAAQGDHVALIRRDRVSYCGAYWGYGFHEDGVRSALDVCAAFDMGLNQ